MIDTEKSLSVTSATVRLMPSTAIEPFSTMPSSISFRAAIRYHTALPSRRTEDMLPVPSMCPVTIWPPNLPFTGRARSRLTPLPWRNTPSEVLRHVSFITSTVKRRRSKSTTVRQMPFTAMLSPIWRSSITFVASTDSVQLAALLRMSATVPTSSTIPVNMNTPPRLPPDNPLPPGSRRGAGA